MIGGTEKEGVGTREATPPPPLETLDTLCQIQLISIFTHDKETLPLINNKLMHFRRHVVGGAAVGTASRGALNCPGAGCVRNEKPVRRGRRLC